MTVSGVRSRIVSAAAWFVLAAVALLTVLVVVTSAPAGSSQPNADSTPVTTPSTTAVQNGHHW